jgi:hypothetical protein
LTALGRVAEGKKGKGGLGQGRYVARERARAARSVSSRSGWHHVTNAWDLAGSRRGREEREARACVGWPEKRSLGRAQRNSDIWDLFKSISN